MAMKLSFLGTRGEIELRCARHRRHSALMLSYRRQRVLVDCGADWAGLAGELAPQAIVITHAHPDHAAGLRHGAPCPVYATAATWERLQRYPITERRVIAVRQPVVVRGMRIEAFAVEHSLRAPAVLYRVTAGRVTVAYVPDLVAIADPAAALRGIRLYIGDGASLHRPIIRRREGQRIGHAAIREQLDWCAAHAVQRALFTHCGSQIVRDHEAAEREVRRLGVERGVAAQLAEDGMELILR